jgi:hypothetical protein
VRRVRFVNQRDDFSCGTIALLNALKWLGKDVTYRKDFNRIKCLCKTTTKGTFISDIYSALRALQITSKYRDSDEYSPSELLLHLYEGGSLILALDWKRKGERLYHGHVVFVYFDGKNIQCVNSNSKGETTEVIPVKILGRRSFWRGLCYRADEAIFL